MYLFKHFLTGACNVTDVYFGPSPPLRSWTSHCCCAKVRQCRFWEKVLRYKLWALIFSPIAQQQHPIQCWRKIYSQTRHGEV